MEHRQIEMGRTAVREPVDAEGAYGIVGTNVVMWKVYKVIERVAANIHPVLILGESGTGKELVARAIHLSGIRRERPFIPVDCGALVPTLMESELFGHERGSFTGAERAKDGLLRMRKVAPSSSMRLVNFLWRFKESSCERYKKRKSVQLKYEADSD